MLHARRLSLPMMGTCVLLVILASSWTRVVVQADTPSAAEDPAKPAAKDPAKPAAKDSAKPAEKDSAESSKADSAESSKADSAESSKADSAESSEDSIEPSADGSSIAKPKAPKKPKIPSAAVEQVCDESKIIESSPPITDVKLKIFTTKDETEFTGDQLHKNVKINQVKITLDGSVKTGNKSTAVIEYYNCSITGAMEFIVAWPDKEGKIDAPRIKNCTVTLLDLKRSDGSLDTALQDSVKEAVSKAALSCVQPDICAKMCWSIQKKVTEKKIKEAGKKLTPKVTEWLLKTLVKRMSYPNKTFTIDLPAPDKKIIEEFLSVDKLNSSMDFSPGVLTLTTGLVNLNKKKAYQKVNEMGYFFNMILQVHNLSIFFEEWKFSFPNVTTKGPVKLELQDMRFDAQFTASWKDKPATLKFHKFELVPSKTHIIDFPGAPGLADNETAEMQRLLEESVHHFINNELTTSIKREVKMVESDPDIEQFRPAFDGTLKVKKWFG